MGPVLLTTIELPLSSHPEGVSKWPLMDSGWPLKIFSRLYFKTNLQSEKQYWSTIIRLGYCYEQRQREDKSNELTTNTPCFLSALHMRPGSIPGHAHTTIGSHLMEVNYSTGKAKKFETSHSPSGRLRKSSYEDSH